MIFYFARHQVCRGYNRCKLFDLSFDPILKYFFSVFPAEYAPEENPSHNTHLNLYPLTSEHNYPHVGEMQGEEPASSKHIRRIVDRFTEDLDKLHLVFEPQRDIIEIVGADIRQ